jgi:rfaE bifunctional protein kinase chain/domain
MSSGQETRLKDKIKPIGDLIKVLSDSKANGSKTVFCQGVFEILHPGHIRYLSAAKQMGDVLVVAVAADLFVNKGPGRPLFREQLRAEIVAALDDVDFVTVNHSADGAEAIRLLKPDVYVLGCLDGESEKGDVHSTEAESAAAVEVGACIKKIDEVSFSSSKVLNDVFTVFPPEVDAFLKEFRIRYSSLDAVGAISSLNDLRVLVIGETILDEYVYGDTLGKAGKEPILALRYLSHETHAGGSVVIANHLADFCSRVDLCTYLGMENPQEDFVRDKLKKNVRPHFFYKYGSPTIVKRRFVEKYSVTKLLELYEMNDTPMAGHEEDELCQKLETLLPECDVVIVADYGHGLMTQRVIDVLCRKARFLSVNTQINAANNGYHTISRYPRADYICLHEGEVRLDQRDRFGKLDDLVVNLSKRLDTRLVMVTQGKHGSLLYSRNDGFSHCPAFAVKIVDRVGAGDSVLAISSLCVARSLPTDLIGFISNMVGAQAVAIVGNRSSIDKNKLLHGIEAILK